MPDTVVDIETDEHPDCVWLAFQLHGAIYTLNMWAEEGLVEIRNPAGHRIFQAPLESNFESHLRLRLSQVTGDALGLTTQGLACVSKT